MAPWPVLLVTPCVAWGPVTARARLITKTTVSILFPLLASLIVRKLVSAPGSLHLNLLWGQVNVTEARDMTT